MSETGTVGEVIGRRRRERGLTLQQLAERAGCARSYLSLIENGRRPPPGDEVLGRLELALGMEAGSLVRLADWEAMPATMRREMASLEGKQRAAQRLAVILESGGRGAARGASALDDAYRTGELRRLIEELAPDGSDGAADWAGGRAVEGGVRGRAILDVPLINKVAAGYPREFTDLGYPARVADEYVRCPGLSDPDAFACRVVGDSMLPEYREGDIVVFSPARAVRSGMDCFARIEPDHESTFKRVYFETGDDGEELIRLQPLNPVYPPRVLPREDVAGLYAAVSVTREVGEEIANGK
jgi:repressor LexA